MIAQFALRLICGMSVTWCFMPRGEVTCGFFRIQMLVTMGLGVLAALTAGGLPAVEQAQSLMPVMWLKILCGLIAAVSFVGSVLWTLTRRGAGGAAAGIVFALSTAALLGGLNRGSFDDAGRAALSVGSELAAAWIIGGSVTAMLLGHWYLTAPMMKLKPLETLNLRFGVAAISRGVLALVALWMMGQVATSSIQTVWLMMRWACGVIVPIVMAVLVQRILRYRNTQSATGVLFAAVILVFIGETTAAVLSRDLHWPL
jgi:hypothetical protein